MLMRTLFFRISYAKTLENNSISKAIRDMFSSLPNVNLVAHLGILG